MMNNQNTYPSTLSYIRAHRADIESIITQYGAHNIAVFGSVAREEDDRNSDIDFLVDMRDGFDLFDKFVIQSKLESLLNRSVDIVTRNSVHVDLKDSIENDAVMLWRRETNVIDLPSKRDAHAINQARTAIDRPLHKQHSPTHFIKQTIFKIDKLSHHDISLFLLKYR